MIKIVKYKGVDFLSMTDATGTSYKAYGIWFPTLEMAYEMKTSTN